MQLTLRNDDGTTTEQVFDLGGDLNHLDAIDEAVEPFKNHTLPRVEQALLSQVQERLAAQEKKHSWTANGSESVTVRTRQGAFGFTRQRFLDRTNMPQTLLPEAMSSALRLRMVEGATRFPFSEVAALPAEGCGRRLLSEDSLWRRVQNHAQQQDGKQEQTIRVVEEQSEEVLPSPECVAVSAMYAGETEEFVVLTEALCVPSQKPTRQQAGQERMDKRAKRHDPDVFVLPRKNGGEQFCCEGLSEHWSCVSAVAAFLRQEWSGETLAVGAITDGAKKIRADLAALFGAGVRENLAMAAFATSEREGLQERLLGLLWQGQVAEAGAFVTGIVPRSKKAHADLLG